MLNIAADHINKIEAKESAERLAQRAQSERANHILNLQRIIADAEHQKTAPIFATEDAATTFQAMKARIDQLSAEYENRLWNERQAGRKYPLGLASEEAIAHFFGDIILEKLPVLADRITSRSGRGSGIFEEKRAAVIAECEATIAEARAKLAELSAQV